MAYKEIALFWIPSHIGIQGNEMVDKQAKTSLSLEPTSFKIPFLNFKPSINKYILCTISLAISYVFASLCAHLRAISNNFNCYDENRILGK